MNTDGMQIGRCIPLGKITKPHGIRGELKVLTYTQQPENLRRYKRIFLSPDQGKTLTPFTVVRIRLHGTQVIMSLAECNDRTMAETLAGQEIWLRANDLPQLRGEEYYLFELEGKRAVTPEGMNIGEIISVVTIGGQDMLLILKNNKEYLIPLVNDFIVSRESSRIVLNLPPGLLEINN